MVYFPINIEEAVKKECKRRRYSDQTIKTYIYCINRFLKFSSKSLDNISKKDVRLFLENLSEKKKAENTMNTYHMAIRFLFEEVLDKRMWINIKYSKVPEKLPIVLTKEEVKRLFEVIKNEKHKLMIELLYSAGLRVSELVHLKVNDLELDKNYGWVRHGKGNRDRLFIIADSLKERIGDYIKKEDLKNDSWLFKGQKEHLHQRSIQEIIKNAKKEAKISKKISSHTLRHSFATHLIENGYDIASVQSLLGHKSPETTFIYVHTASKKLINIKSPLDEL